MACPAILNSHVKYWVNINAVGPRLFTFFAPHTRIGYLGRGVYRYRMTLGRSDDNEWISPELQAAETPFRLARFGGNSPRDVILLAPDADAAALTQAIEALMVVRSQSGDAASANATFRVQQPQRPRVLPWAARVLQDLRGAAPREIPGVGRLRAVQIYLPAQRGGGGIGSGN